MRKAQIYIKKQEKTEKKGGGEFHLPIGGSLPPPSVGLKISLGYIE